MDNLDSMALETVFFTALSELTGLPGFTVSHTKTT